ncbi:MAG: 2'-5' RNA ligase family protein [Chloroflexi bacterium]|nr:2'-5' RNA ligase family protein [Chloroflexota bacterium]
MSRYRKRKRSPQTVDPRQRIGDYRIFVGAFPTGKLAANIQAVREQYDATTAQITPPHITLAGTYWRDGNATPQNEAAIIEKLHALSSSIAPFELKLGGIYTFGQRVVYLGVSLSDQLLVGRSALLDILGRDKHRKFKPHLTLAMRLKQPEFDAMVAELQDTIWHTEQFAVPITELHLMQRGANDPAWRSIYTLPLTG